MAALRWDTESQAYVEPNEAPKRYDPASGAWVETTGMAWDEESQAWTERWGENVSAYVYGAASETVTIKKNGIIVATVATNSSGCSNEKISIGYGTYTLTGSVSGWTEEQTVDKYTTKFRSMPEGALYWYGNECSDVTGGWSDEDYVDSYLTENTRCTKNPCTKNTNDIYLDTTYSPSKYVYSICGTKNKVNLSNYTNAKITWKNNHKNAVFCVNTKKDIRDVFGNAEISNKTGGSASDTVETSSFDFSSLDNEYIMFCMSNSPSSGLQRTITMYAVWLE